MLTLTGLAVPTLPDFDEKVEAAIRQKLEAGGNGAINNANSQ